MFREQSLIVLVVLLGVAGCGKSGGGGGDPYERGVRHFSRQEYDQAVVELTEAIRRDPRDPYAYHSRGLAYFQKKEYEKAVNDHSDAIRHDDTGDVVDYYLSRAVAYSKLKRYKDALLDYEDAVRNEPEDALVLNDLAWFLATCPDDKLRDGKRALELSKKACDLDPMPTYWDTLAAAYAEVGDFAEAVKWQEKALAEPDRGIQDDLVNAKRRLQLFKEGKPFRDP